MTVEFMNREKYPWIYDVIFLLVLVLAGYLRLTGVNWGEGQHQHPDELFLTGVLESLRAHECADASIPVDVCPPEQKHWISPVDYFSSSTSPLNPFNRGYTFFVYGNLPMTMVREAAEILDGDGSLDLKMIGRQFSALADLFTILMLYFIVARLYGRKVGLLASLFSALTVMQIQQSHFFTSDLFVNAFAFLAIYFAVAILDTRYSTFDIRESKSDIREEILQNQEERLENQEAGLETGDSPNLQSPREASNYPREVPNSPISNSRIIAKHPGVTNLRSLISTPLFFLSRGFGVAYGMALACKVNIYPLAILLPGAFILRHFILQKEMASADAVPAAEDGGLSVLGQRQVPLTTNYWLLITTCLIAGGLAALISFRIFQPYAFDGLLPSEQWIKGIQEQRVQAQGDADLPWNLQWARRSHLYSFTNLTLWGLGLPLGILAWAGFLYMGWRIFKGEWRHALLWGWTALYFIWQSLQFNPTMRYQLPIYPLLAMMAAWFVFELAGLRFRKPLPTAEEIVEQSKPFSLATVLASIIAITVIVLTAIWAFAFQSIYLRPEPRIAASRWIYQNIPGPINVQIQTGDSIYNQPLSFPINGFIQPEQPHDAAFVAQRDGMVESIILGHAANTLSSSSTLSLILSDTPAPTPEQALATASITSNFSTRNDLRGNSYTLVLDQPVEVVKGTQYYLRIEVDSGVLALKGASISNETDYDYGLPFRVDSYDAFGGLYRGDLNLQVYWDDNEEKLNRFVTTLDQTDYIFIPTNHQYAQITRLPERYPLTTLYYRELVGCPEDKDIIWCYRVAQPDQFEGRLGFDLVAV